MAELTTDLKTTSQPVSPVFQVLLMLMSATLIATIYVHRLRQFRVLDGMRPPDPVPAEIRTDFPKKIYVGFFIENYEKFNIIKDDFICSAYIWFACDPGTVSLSSLDRFEFDRCKILYRSQPYVSIINEQLVVSYQVRMQFSAALVYSLFPFDEHRITIELANKGFAPQEAVFEVDNRTFIVKALATSFGWKLVDNFVLSGIETVPLDPFDEQKTMSYISAHFYIDYTHHSVRLVMSIVLPMLLIFYLSLLSLSMRGPYQSTAAVAALTGIITYRFVIDNLSPQVGYFMISDFLFISFLVGSFCSLVVAFLDTFGANISLRLKKGVIAMLHFVIVCINIYLTTM